MGSASTDEPAGVQGASNTDAPVKLAEFLPYRLHLAASLVSDGLLRVCGKHGLGEPEWKVLMILGQSGPMLNKDISNLGRMHRTNVSRAVAVLDRLKLISRRRARDLRSERLALTATGRETYEAVAFRSLQFDRRLWEAIDPADRAGFERGLSRVMEAMLKETAGSTSVAAPHTPQDDT